MRIAFGRLAALLLALGLLGQAPGRAQSLPSIPDKTRGMQRLDGFVPLWDGATGKLYLECPARARTCCTWSRSVGPARTTSG
jgi:hypothetical protein